jgi:C4-dicarboxylate-specific signal transduction histidine kinase
MDIICKCGHEADNHDDYGCISCAYKCEINEREVLHIHITEQQARLDTNRAQVAALIAERDVLKEERRRLVSQLVEGGSIMAGLRQIIADLMERAK